MNAQDIIKAKRDIKLSVKIPTPMDIYLIEKPIIMKWFKATDYIVNKIVVGEWTVDDPRYVDYLAKRAEMRAKLDALELSILPVDEPEVEEEAEPEVEPDTTVV